MQHLLVFARWIFFAGAQRGKGQKQGNEYQHQYYRKTLPGTQIFEYFGHAVKLTQNFGGNLTFGSLTAYYGLLGR